MAEPVRIHPFDFHALLEKCAKKSNGVVNVVNGPAPESPKHTVSGVEYILDATVPFDPQNDILST